MQGRAGVRQTEVRRCSNVDSRMSKGDEEGSGTVFKELKLGSKRKGSFHCPGHTPEPHTDSHPSEVKCWFGELTHLSWKQQHFLQIQSQMPLLFGRKTLI